MAAPSSTQWGAIKGSGTKQGRIGINITYSDTATTRKVTIAIWYWTRYRVQDSGNTFKYGWGTSANTTIGAKNINTTSNSSWSTTNQIAIGTYSKTYNRGTSNGSGSASASFSNVDYGGGSGSVTVNFSIPALASYKITYNTNGGTGAPGAQTKWYGKNITISSSKPSRTGYTFQGWATSASGGVSYNPGATYSGNAALNLYAVWKANTFTVSYNANGGTGAPGNQTKTYGVNLTLSSTKPTRTNYNFKGWGTSAGSTTVSYAPGATYSGNAAITLYAIWELAYVAPRIANFAVSRCNSTGTEDDAGTYIKVVFNWATDRSVSSIKINSKKSTETTFALVTNVDASGTSGSVNQIIGNGRVNTEYTFNIQVVVTDSGGSSNQTRTVEPMTFTLDLLKGGKGASFGKPASLQDTLEIGFKTRFSGGIDAIEISNEGDDLNDYTTPGYYRCALTATAKTLLNCPVTEAFVMEVFRHTNSGFQQKITTYNPNNIRYLIRNVYNGTWGPWQTIINTDFLDVGTDLNTVTTPGIYYGNTGNYINIPSIRVNSSFLLEVFPIGSQGQLLQRLTRCLKNGENVCVRTYYESAWGAWTVLSYPERRVLWSGGYYMTANHTADLSEPITGQEHGVVLIFSYYNGGIKNEQMSAFFVPKEFVYRHGGAGLSFNVTSHWANCMKYLYVNDNKITGNDNNSGTRTVGGVTYNNGNCVLRYVIGV